MSSIQGKTLTAAIDKQEIEYFAKSVVARLSKKNVMKNARLDGVDVLPYNRVPQDKTVTGVAYLEADNTDKEEAHGLEVTNNEDGSYHVNLYSDGLLISDYVNAVDDLKTFNVVVSAEIDTDSLDSYSAKTLVKTFEENADDGFIEAAEAFEEEKIKEEELDREYEKYEDRRYLDY